MAARGLGGAGDGVLERMTQRGERPVSRDVPAPERPRSAAEMDPRKAIRTTTVRLRKEQVDALNQVASQRAAERGIYKLDHSEVLREILDEGLRKRGLLE